MQFDDACRLWNEWKRKGDGPCDHPSREREYYLGANTGDVVCSVCGRYVDEPQDDTSASAIPRIQNKATEPLPDWHKKAKRRWGRKAAWIKGYGQYALLAWCRGLTITLHETEDGAKAAKRLIDEGACGGICARHNEIIDLTEDVKSEREVHEIRKTNLNAKPRLRRKNTT